MSAPLRVGYAGIAVQSDGSLILSTYAAGRRGVGNRYWCCMRRAGGARLAAGAVRKRGMQDAHGEGQDACRGAV